MTPPPLRVSGSDLATPYAAAGGDRAGWDAAALVVDDRITTALRWALDAGSDADVVTRLRALLAEPGGDPPPPH